jgi:hypothetical protein
MLTTMSLTNGIDGFTNGGIICYSCNASNTSNGGWGINGGTPPGDPQGGGFYPGVDEGNQFKPCRLNRIWQFRDGPTATASVMGFPLLSAISQVRAMLLNCNNGSLDAKIDITGGDGCIINSNQTSILVENRYHNQPGKVWEVFTVNNVSVTFTAFLNGQQYTLIGLGRNRAHFLLSYN